MANTFKDKYMRSRGCGDPRCPICNDPYPMSKEFAQMEREKREIRHTSRSREEYEARMEETENRYREEMEYKRKSTIKPQIITYEPGEVVRAREELMGTWGPEPMPAPKPKKQTLGRVKSQFEDDGFLESLLNADQSNQEEINETVGIDGFQSLLKAND